MINLPISIQKSKLKLNFVIILARDSLEFLALWSGYLNLPSSQTLRTMPQASVYYLFVIYFSLVLTTQGIFFFTLHTISLSEVKKMGRDSKESINYQNNDTSQDSIMNKVNQTLDEMVQDVKNLVNENDKESNIK